MSEINRKDFIVTIEVNDANPNGDPYYDNNPRTFTPIDSSDSYGVISGPCIKRKIRNRLQDIDCDIYNQANERITDECTSLAARAKKIEADYKKESGYDGSCTDYILEKYIDLRMFGDCFAYKDLKEIQKVRGAVSICEAYSVAPITIVEQHISRSTNGQEVTKKEDSSSNTRSSDTLGERKFAKHGLYVMHGSVNAQFAEKNHMSEEDCEKLKKCLQTLFVNDESSARPAGSMRVVNVYWFDHNCKDGQYSQKEVIDSVEIKVKDSVDTPTCYDDYEVVIHPLEGLTPEVIKGW